MTDIVKDFPGVRALKGVQLKVRPGTVHTLMGENGAGKSTLMKCLIGIHPPTSGKIVFDGKEIHFKTTLEALNSGIDPSGIIAGSGTQCQRKPLAGPRTAQGPDH